VTSDGDTGPKPAPRLSKKTDMKEYLKKFSADDNESQADGREKEMDPSQQGPPVFHDLRFVVKESVNLGFRFVDELGKMLKKLEE
jgi:hypothetical protein